MRERSSTPRSVLPKGLPTVDRCDEAPARRSSRTHRGGSPPSEHGGQRTPQGVTAPTGAATAGTTMAVEHNVDGAHLRLGTTGTVLRPISAGRLLRAGFAIGLECARPTPKF